MGTGSDDVGAVDAGSAYVFSGKSDLQTVEERLAILGTKTAELDSTVSDMLTFVIDEFTNLFSVFPTVQTDVADLQVQIALLEYGINALENP